MPPAARPEWHRLDDLLWLHRIALHIVHHGVPVPQVYDHRAVLSRDWGRNGDWQLGQWEVFGSGV
jgi:hypothetical protein